MFEAPVQYAVTGIFDWSHRLRESGEVRELDIWQL